MRRALASAFVVCASCSLTLAPDSALTGGSGDASPACDLDAASTDVAGCWLWSAAAHGAPDGWTIDNSTVDGNGPLDCCGCAVSCSKCTDNTSISVQGGVITFGSGPEIDGGTNHRVDGFTARYADLPVIPSRQHTMSFDLVALDANIGCGASPCQGSTETFQPSWSVAIYDGTTQLGNASAVWSAFGCTACTSSPAEVGTTSFAFTPAHDTVTLVVSAQHRSSTCEPWGVSVGMDWLSVVAQ